MVSIHSRRWFHKWSSTLSDHQMKNASLNYKSSSVSIGWPMLSQRGVVTQIDNKIKNLMCGISRSPTQDTSYKWYLQVVSFQQSSNVHKKCKIQASTIYPKCITLHQWEAHLLWKLMTKGERVYKDMKAYIKRRDKIWKLKRLDMNMDKGEATLKKRDGS